MKRIFTLILALSLLALTCRSGGGTGETDSLTPEERTQRFVTAITDARSEEDNEYNSILSSADDDTADMTFQLLGVTTEDMESFAISVSLMNVKAYGIARHQARTGQRGHSERGPSGLYRPAAAEFPDVSA